MICADVQLQLASVSRCQQLEADKLQLVINMSLLTSAVYYALVAAVQHLYTLPYSSYNHTIIKPFV